MPVTYVNLFNSQINPEVGIMVISYLQMRKLKHRDLSSLIRVTQVVKWQGVGLTEDITLELSLEN